MKGHNIEMSLKSMRLMALVASWSMVYQFIAALIYNSIGKALMSSSSCVALRCRSNSLNQGLNIYKQLFCSEALFLQMFISWFRNPAKKKRIFKITGYLSYIMEVFDNGR